MDWHLNLEVISLLVIGLITMGVGFSLLRQRNAPGAFFLTCMLVASAEWCLTSALELATLDPGMKIFASKLQYLGIYAIAPAYVLFAIESSSEKRRMNYWLFASLWVVPTVTVLLAFTNEAHHLIWTGFRQVDDGANLIYHHGPWFWIAAAYSYGCLLVGSGLILGATLNLARFKWGQVFIILTAILIPSAANLLYIGDRFPIPGLDPTPFAFSVSTLLFALNIYRFHIFDMTILARSQLVDALLDAVLAVNQNGILFDLNPAAQHIFGVEISEIIGKPLHEALKGWDELQDMLTRPPVANTRLEITQGANQRWYDTQITPITNSRHQLKGWLIVLHDITRQKEIEVQATRLAAVVEQAQETIVITDLAGNIEYANPYFEVITGYTLSDAARKNPRLLKSGLQTPEFYQHLWKTIKSGQPWQGKFINRRKDGSFYHESATIFPIKDERGQIINYAAVKRDITDQVEAERIIQDSERRYRLLADNVSDVIWTMNLEGRFTYVSPSVEALRGYTPEEVLQQSLKEALTPESAITAYQAFENFLQAIQHDPNQPGAILEFEQTRKNGGTVWTESIISIMYDDDGHVLGLLGVTRNIQARKIAEAEQQISMRQQALLNEITQAAIAEIDLPAMLQILTDRLGELFNADGCYITLWDEEKQMGIPAAAYGPMRDTYTHPQNYAKPGEPTFTVHLHETRQTLIIPDVFASPYISPRLAERYPSKSMIGLPLIANQRFLGALLISYHEQHAFTNNEVQRSEAVAQQVALAILKAQLLTEAQRRATEAETLRKAGAAVASTLHQEEAIERVLQELKRVVPYDSASVMLLRGEELEIVGENGFNRSMSVLGLRFAVLKNTPNSVVFQTRQAHIIEDAPSLYEDFRRPPSNLIHGWLGVPIQANDRMIGMLALDSHQPGAFTKEHARLATAFADQVAIALENSRLFEETQRLAITDALTGLFNRRHLMAEAEREYLRSRRYAIPFSIIMLDIDHFKKVNDTYGHLAGDLTLQQLAQICSEHLRATDTIGRYGGEELIILLPETTVVVASKAAERLRNTTANHAITSERANFSITISLGVAELDASCQKLDELIDRADQALYRAKNTGRNRVVTWPLL